MSFTRRKAGVVIAIVAIIAMALAASYFMQPKRAADAAPDELLGMEKVVVLEGEEAIEDVRQKHIGAVENMEDMAIVQYGPAYHQIVLWITLYPSDDIAASENEKMADAMVRGRGKHRRQKCIQNHTEWRFSLFLGRGRIYFLCDNTAHLSREYNRDNHCN